MWFITHLFIIVPMFYFWQQCVLYLCFSVCISANKLLLLVLCVVDIHFFSTSHNLTCSILCILYLYSMLNACRAINNNVCCSWHNDGDIDHTVRNRETYFICWHWYDAANVQHCAVNDHRYFLSIRRWSLDFVKYDKTALNLRKWWSRGIRIELIDNTAFIDDNTDTRHYLFSNRHVLFRARTNRYYGQVNFAS